MSDTPRTDMEAAPFPISIGEEAEFDWVPAEFAKELERELAAAKEALTKAEAERDALREELGRFQASRIQLNANGSLDEIVGSPGHLEQLGSNHWFVCLGDYAVWLHAKGKITASYEDRAAIDAARAK